MAGRCNGVCRRRNDLARRGPEGAREREELLDRLEEYGDERALKPGAVSGSLPLRGECRPVGWMLSIRGARTIRAVTVPTG